ncbi:MAG: ATP-binding cassette domain-containing protein [Clostridia bacterium]|nr:ATP-binding cassette domain-containing protein [Clostridia bacterium]
MENFVKKTQKFAGTAAEKSSAVPIVSLDHVTKVYGTHKVIDDLCLEVKEGEFLSIIGPSGCGKSTTLRMIGGFLNPTEGDVYLGGEKVTERSAAERVILFIEGYYGKDYWKNIKKNNDSIFYTI